MRGSRLVCLFFGAGFMASVVQAADGQRSKRKLDDLDAVMVAASPVSQVEEPPTRDPSEGLLRYKFAVEPYIQIGRIDLLQNGFGIAAKYQMAKNLWIGTDIGAATVNGRLDEIEGYTVTPHLAYSLSVTESVLLWPRVGYSIRKASLDGSEVGTASIVASIPLMFRSEGFFVGPAFEWERLSTVTALGLTVDADDDDTYGGSLRLGFLLE